MICMCLHLLCFLFHGNPCCFLVCLAPVLQVFAFFWQQCALHPCSVGPELMVDQGTTFSMIARVVICLLSCLLKQSQVTGCVCGVAEQYGGWFLLALFGAILTWEEVWDLPNSAALSAWLLLLITAGAMICSWSVTCLSLGVILALCTFALPTSPYHY